MNIQPWTIALIKANVISQASVLTAINPLLVETFPVATICYYR